MRRRSVLLTVALLAIAPMAPAAHADTTILSVGCGAVAIPPVDDGNPWDTAIMYGQGDIVGVYGDDATPARLGHDLVMTCSLQTGVDYGTGTQLASLTATAPGLGNVAVIPPTQVTFPAPITQYAYMCWAMSWIDMYEQAVSWVFDNDPDTPGIQCY